MRGRAGQRLPGYWIDDENLLRDEGVLFGLSCGDAESPETLQAMREKVACIEAHHERLAQRAAAMLVFNEAEFIRLVAALTEADTDVERTRLAARAAQEVRIRLESDARTRARDRADRSAEAAATRHAVPDALAPSEPYQIARYTVGLALALAACVGVVVLVYDLLDHSRFDFALPVSLGVALAGLFCTFQPLALVLAGDARVQGAEAAPEMWKLRFAEWSLPLVAAAFVAYWASVPATGLGAAQRVALDGPLQVGITFVFLAVFFVLGGKLLLGLSTRLAIVLRQRRAATAAREESVAEAEREAAADLAEHLHRVADADAERARLTGLATAAEAHAATLREQAERLRIGSREARAEREGWARLATQRVALFRSEFWLAVEQRRMARERPAASASTYVPDDGFSDDDEDGTVIASSGDGASRASSFDAEPDVDFGDDV